MLALVVTVQQSDVEVASDVLWQLGVRAIEERHADHTGTPAVELWTSVGDEPDAVERAERAVGGRWQTRFVRLGADDLVAASTWREHARPMWVHDHLVVVPAWTPTIDAATSPDVLVVQVEPGGAFGLGDHPTTLLSLRATARLVDGPCDVLDVGCGTGVIAVTAALLQERAVRAIDVASAAVEATLDNAARNGVADRVVVDSAPAGDVDADFDLVVANILAPTLIELSPELRRLTRSHGRLVISGILADRHQHVLDALTPMTVERTDALDGWVAVTLRHP